MFKRPRKDDVVRFLLRPDLDAAGISYRDETGRYADFHALRYSFITNLGRSGVHPKTAQELARHSDLTLTSRYTHGFKGDEIAAINALPNINPTLDNTAKATGTDSRPVTESAPEEDESVLALCLAQTGRFESISMGAYG